jgi:hypothetical protein
VAPIHADVRRSDKFRDVRQTLTAIEPDTCLRHPTAWLLRAQHGDVFVQRGGQIDLVFLLDPQNLANFFRDRIFAERFALAMRPR